MSTTQDARRKFTIASAQENLYSNNLGAVVGAVDTEKTGTVYNPYTSKPAVSDGVVSGASYTVGTYTAEADSLQVNRRAVASEHVDSFDEGSIDLDLMADRGMNYGEAINNKIDGYFLSRPVGVSGITELDAGDFGGSAGSPVAATSSNIDDIINTSLQEIHIANSMSAKKFMAVSPLEANDLRGYLQGTGNMVADDVIVNGFESSVVPIGTSFSGVDFFVTNNLTNKVVLGLATNPSDGDTISFLGVTYTFVDTLSGAAGEVHITGSVDATRANLAEAINNPGDDEAEATNTGYSALSAADQDKFSRLSVSASNDDSADELTVTAYSTIYAGNVSETLTDGTDTWGTPFRYSVFGDYGAINLYLPSSLMSYEEKAVSGKHGRELEMSQAHNSVVWTRQKERVLTIELS